MLNLIPILFALLLCFNRWDDFNPMEFVGLDNFKYIFTHKPVRPGSAPPPRGTATAPAEHGGGQTILYLALFAYLCGAALESINR